MTLVPIVCSIPFIPMYILNFNNMKFVKSKFYMCNISYEYKGVDFRIPVRVRIGYFEFFGISV